MLSSRRQGAIFHFVYISPHYKLTVPAGQVLYAFCSFWASASLFQDRWALIVVHLLCALAKESRIVLLVCCLNSSFKSCCLHIRAANVGLLDLGNTTFRDHPVEECLSLIRVRLLLSVWVSHSYDTPCVDVRFRDLQAACPVGCCHRRGEGGTFPGSKFSCAGPMHHSGWNPTN